MNKKILLAMVTMAFVVSIVAAPSMGNVYATKNNVDQENNCDHAKCSIVGQITYNECEKAGCKAKSEK